MPIHIPPDEQGSGVSMTRYCRVCMACRYNQLHAFVQEIANASSIQSQVESSHVELYMRQS